MFDEAAPVSHTERRWPITDHQQDLHIISVAVLGDGRFVTTGKQLKLWNPNADDPTQPERTWDFVKPPRQLGYAKYLSDHLFMVTEACNKVSYVVDANTGDYYKFDGLRASQGHECVYLGRYLIAKTSHQYVRVWDIQNGQPVCDQFHTGHESLGVVSVVSDDSLITSGADSIKIWKVSLAQRPPFSLVKVMPAEINAWRCGKHVTHDSIIYLPHLFPDKQCIAWGTNGLPCRIMIHDIGPSAINNEPLFYLERNDRLIEYSVKFDDTKIISWANAKDCPGENPIILWDVQNKRRLAQLQGHTKPIWNVVKLSDHYIASAGGDGVKIWNLDSQTAVETIVLLFSDRAVKISALPDGRLVCLAPGVIHLLHFPYIQPNPIAEDQAQVTPIPAPRPRLCPYTAVN